MKIGTHNGNFHCDDVLAVAILKMVDIDKSTTIVRTRDQKVLDTCDAVVDVGGVYSPETFRYDHHQEGRAGARANGVLYSAAGLVWKHHGLQVCGMDQGSADEVDSSFIQAVCAVDNGQKLYEGGVAAFRQNGRAIHGQSFSSLISSLNPEWTEEKTFDKAFDQAVEIATLFLKRELARVEGLATAKLLTTTALHQRQDKRILVLERYHPWHEVAMTDPEVIYTIFPNEVGTWMVQCVPPSADDHFGKRLPLPEAWAGKREDLADVLGLPGTVFCHPGRFICGHKTREGALKLAELALAHQPEDRPQAA
jgi:uncharacterized UPF0160 family protein